MSKPTDIPEAPEPLQLREQIIARLRAYRHADSDNIELLTATIERPEMITIDEANGLTNVVADSILALLTSKLETATTETQLKADIRYHTLKARYQRMFLGGEADALSTKRYVKKLKSHLAQLHKADQDGLATSEETKQ